MIIFVRTRHIYDSYTDFWKLVELSGFDTCFVDEINISSENTYIFTPINGEYVNHINAQKNDSNKIWKAKLIWWNLERQIPEENDTTHHDIVNEIWVSDRYYATLNSKFKFVILGSHSGLRLNQDDLPKVYDYCHISYITGRRGPLHHELAKRGLRSSPNGWGNERDIILRSSKVLVNIHQDSALIAEPLRFAVCAAYSLPLISEMIYDPYPLINDTDIIVASCDNIVNTAVANYNSNLIDMGNSLYNKMCIQNNFKTNIEKALI